jgi:hypothetical protein
MVASSSVRELVFEVGIDTEAASAFLRVLSLIFIVASSSVGELVFEVGIDTGSSVHARGK